MATRLPVIYNLSLKTKLQHQYQNTPKWNRQITEAANRSRFKVQISHRSNWTKCCLRLATAAKFL